MTLAGRSNTGAPLRYAGSPYRVGPRPAPGGTSPRRTHVAPTVVGVLLFVLGCSLVRFGLFVSRGERLGVDPVLALAAAAASAYVLARLLGWRGR